MKSYPPHLPPKLFEVSWHVRIRSLAWIFFVVGISCLSGLTASLVAVGWLAPLYTPEGNVYLFGKRAAPASSVASRAVDSALERQLRQHTLSLYDTREKVNKTYYPQNATITQATLLTSDGWAVAYAPSFAPGQEKFWEAVDGQGVLYRIEDAVAKNKEGLVYIKVQGSGFRVTTFPNWSAIGPDTPLLAVEADTIEPIVLGALAKRTEKNTYPIWQTLFSYTVEGGKPGSVVVNADGALAGFIGNDGFLVFGWSIVHELPSLLDNATLSYRAPSWEGYLVRGFTNGGTLKKETGFLISRASTRASSSTIGVGDVVIAVNGETVDELSLPRAIDSAGDPFMATILRAGVPYEMVVPKEDVFP